MTTTSTYLIDWDGILADSSHRIRIDNNGCFDLGYWIEHSTADNVSKDKPLPYCDIVRSLLDERDNGADIQLMIVTARVLKQSDYQWLFDNVGNFDAILNRSGRNDTRRDSQLKIDLIKPLIASGVIDPSNCLFVDDNLSNIEALSELGIDGLHIPFEAVGNSAHLMVANE